MISLELRGDSRGLLDGASGGATMHWPCRLLATFNHLAICHDLHTLRFLPAPLAASGSVAASVAVISVADGTQSLGATSVVDGATESAGA